MRHGRTDWNERNKLQGRTDIPLNAAGRKMAEEAAAALLGCDAVDDVDVNNYDEVIGAPKPLSILTTLTPLAQELSIESSADKPPKLAP